MVGRYEVSAIFTNESIKYPGFYFDVLIPGSPAHPFKYGYNMVTNTHRHLITLD